MIYIAGVSVLTPNKKIKRFLKRQKQVKDFIADFIKHTSTLDVFIRTKKVLDVTHRTIPKNIPINSIFWPTGAGRFAIGVFLVTERVASYIFNVSGMQSRQVVAYDRMSTSTFGFSSHCFAQLESQSENEGGSSQEIPPFTNDLLEAAAVMNDGMTAVNLMPVPVVVTQRSKSFMPFRYQSYFATWLIPVMYIPIVESDAIRAREEYKYGVADGFGVLIMVDQRYLWNFIYIPQSQLASADLNECYFHWYRLLDFLRGYLMPEQTDPSRLIPYGRSYFVDTISPDVQGDDNPCKVGAEDRNRIAFDDDRAYWGPPIDLWSEGVDYTLSELFAIIEQSLNKRLLFHPNWQVEFINSVIGRKRMIRNLLLFVPRVVYKNDELFKEIEVNPPPKERRFVSEKLLQSGGIIKNFPTTFSEVGDDGTILFRTDRILANPEPRYPIVLPHVIEVVGNLYLTARDEVKKPSPSADAASFYPLQYVYYQCCLVPKSQIKVSNSDMYDWLEDGHLYHFSYKPTGEKVTYEFFQQIFIPGTIMGRFSSSQYDISKLRILTSHLCIVRTNADNSKKETKDESPTHLNRRPSWRLGRAIVRDFLGWLLFPFTWHFKNANYWPLTGYEDYILICNNGSVYVKGHHAKLIGRKTGIKYVGWQSPYAIVNVTDKHKLLDSKVHHVDGSEESPVKGAVVASYPKGGIVEIESFKINGENLRTKATVWSSIPPPT